MVDLGDGYSDIGARCFSTSRNLFAFATRHHGLLLCDVEKATVWGLLECRASDIRDLVFSPDGQLLVSVTETECGM